MAGWRIDPIAQALLKPQATLTGRLFFCLFFLLKTPLTADSSSWRVSCKSPSNRHKTSARGHCTCARTGRKVEPDGRNAEKTVRSPVMNERGDDEGSYFGGWPGHAHQ
jgi:hypothetical protein